MQNPQELVGECQHHFHWQYITSCQMIDTVLLPGE